MFIYRPDVLDQLLQHGARPTAATRPELVHEFVGDLYRYRLRQLRERFRRKEFPKSDYYGRVVEMRMRYRILAMKPFEWLIESENSEPGTEEAHRVGD
ncbi:MAG: hypothetical protein A3F69_06230 [Acidobacteria bacterium RIFCSPLOWO2_12_FULL_66_10]|nr:MAG: hypothetical protein A3F69_06230 [Acidobacteria bacterium RIFCSPLOWO2_12_FULL_66_10]